MQRAVPAVLAILVFVALATTSAPASVAGRLRGEPEQIAMAQDGPPPGWPDTILTPAPPPPSPGDAPAPGDDLPEATLTEPFEIGEAFYDPLRAGDAAISLLKILGVAIVDGDRVVRPGRASGGAPFRLTIEEARAFVEIAGASAEQGPGPMTFADLYRAVESRLSGWSAERLAQAYASTYERRPDTLAARVMMGQPITVEMPLLFPQAWLLLLDGFVPPRRAAGVRVVRASFLQTPPGTTDWGAVANERLQLSHNASWEEAASRIAFWVWAHAPRVQPDPVRPHEGHGGPGTPVTLSATINASPRPLRTSTGSTAVYAQPRPQVAGIPATWNSWDEAKLLAHGTLSHPLGQPVATDASGTARITYQPKPETARGRGDLTRDVGYIRVSWPLRQLAQAFFQVQLGIEHLIPDYEIGNSARMNIEWHELDTIELVIQNVYSFRLPIPGATATRKGRDTIFGTLGKTPDGTWHGVLRTMVNGQNQELNGECGTTKIYAEQDMTVTGSSITTLTNLTRSAAVYQSVVNSPGSDKLKLEFVPASAPQYWTKRSKCWPNIPTPLAPFAYVPLNDARWTTPDAGYAIQLPDEGGLSYVEHAVGSTWYVRMNRRRAQ